MGKEYKVEVYKSGNGPSAKLRPLAIQRKWMDSGVYHCIPIATANKIGKHEVDKLNLFLNEKSKK